MQVKNRRENVMINENPPVIPSIEQIENAIYEDGFITDDDVATAESVGVVSIGDNIEVDENGAISVPNATRETPGVISLSDIPEGNYLPVELYSGTASGAVTFTFPQGKTISDYSFILVCAYYDNTAGTPDECITALIPTALIIASGEEGIKTRINYDGTYYWNAVITPTGVSNPAGQYFTHKVYAF